MMNIQQLFANSFKNEDGTYNNEFSSKELEIIRNNKLFKCFLPSTLGGLEMDLFETLDVIEQCAFVNGSLGWMTQIANGGNYFITNLAPSVAQEFFSAEDAVLSGSGTPTGIATPVEGGYVFDGISRNSSGSDYATIFTATSYIEGSKEIISAIIPRNEVEILNDWDSMGMRLSSTNTTRFNNVFVPHERVFKTDVRISHFEIPILDLPFVIYAQAFFIHVVYGITLHLLDEATKILAARKALWQEVKPERFEQLDAYIKKGKSKINEYKTESRHLFDTLAKNELGNAEYHEHVRVAIVAQCKDLKKFTNELFPLLGMEVLYRKHAANVCYLDLLTICQHGLLN